MGRATTEFLSFPELHEGAELRLSLIRIDSSSSDARAQLNARVTRAFRPFTMSPVLLVTVHASATSQMGTSEAILKLYDRRCLANLRDDFDEGKPWSLDKEREFRQYLDDVSSGAAAAGDFDDPCYLYDNEVSDGAFEAYLRHAARKIFTAERAAYERLAELQGKMIPRLYGIVEYEIAVPDPRGDVAETVPGLLLEYVAGPTLRQLVDTWTAREPRLSNELLAALCEQAVRVVDRVSDFDVLNEDVRIDNFIVREPFVQASTSSPALVEDSVVLIDLGHCRLRGCAESDDDWLQAKSSQDETGAVGFVLLGRIQERVGQDVWTFEKSRRYYRPVE